MTQPMGQAGPTTATDPDVLASGVIVLAALGALVMLRVAFRSALK